MIRSKEPIPPQLRAATDLLRRFHQTAGGLTSLILTVHRAMRLSG